MKTDSFIEAFPDLFVRCRELYGTLSVCASVVVFAGLICAAVSGSYGDVGKAIRGLVMAALVVAMIGIFPKVANLGQDMIRSLVTEIGADPSESHQQFASMIAGPKMADGQDIGLWDVLSSSEGGFGKAILYAIILFLAKIAFVVMWLAFAAQNLLLLVEVAITPLFLAMLTLESTRALAGKFFLSLVALASWPLGWAICDIFSTGVIRMLAGRGAFQPNIVDDVFLVLVISIWLPLSTIAAPYAIHKLLVHGAQVGGSLLQSVGMATSQGTSYALGAGVTASLGGGGRLATSAAATAGAVGGMVSGAAGSSGVLIPAMIGTAAVMASSSKKPEQDAKEMAEKLRMKKS